MDAPQFPNYRDQTHGSETATGSRNPSPVRRILLVAVLAGGALAALAMQANTTTDQSSPALAGTSAISAPGAGNDAQARSAASTAEYYFPAQYANQARSNDGNVMTYEHD